MDTYDGVLFFHSETGTEGGYWAFVDARHITMVPPVYGLDSYDSVCDKDDRSLKGRVVSARHLSGRRIKSLKRGTVVLATIAWNDGTQEERRSDTLLIEAWGYEGLLILADGDELTIYDPANPETVVWSGTINLQQYDLFTEDARGMWIHADQIGVSREVWADWFRQAFPAKLVRP